MKLVNLAEYRNRELVAVCKELLRLAEEGEAMGLAFVLKLGRGDHRGGLSGDYRRNPDEALAAAVRLKMSLMQRNDDEEKHSGT